MAVEIKKRSLQAFLTGSHAYGYPGPDSDIDLVVLVTKDEFDKLRQNADSMEGVDEQYDENGSCSLRFGNLNLLCFFDERRFLDWKKCTEVLKTQAPVSRSFACRYFEERSIK